MVPFCRPSRLAVLAGCLAASAAAGPVLAQAALAAPSPAGTSPAASNPQGSSGSNPGGKSGGGLGRSGGARIESHIARLHASLRITAAQEPLWQVFAGALRDTVARMDAAYAGRQRDHATADAVRDLQAYGAIEEANARNVQLLLPPFRALYDSFSADQKRTADATFRRYTDKAVRRPD